MNDWTLDIRSQSSTMLDEKGKEWVNVWPGYSWCSMYMSRPRLLLDPDEYTRCYIYMVNCIAHSGSR